MAAGGVADWEGEGVRDRIKFFGATGNANIEVDVNAWLAKQPDDTEIVSVNVRSAFDSASGPWTAAHIHYRVPPTKGLQ